MRIFGMGPMEIALIVGVILLLFGPKQLPKLAKSLGKSAKALREGMEGKLEDDDDGELESQSATAKKAAAASAADDEE
ncbi:MAG: twin-arginine translocase TatA/TatE family subunit [Coriobacteriia bacterium]|nr:twin-arginine translocase TatA/TatE family subunit [Coriobacteriia bacterium]